MPNFIALEISDLIPDFSLILLTCTPMVSSTLLAHLHLPLWVIPKISQLQLRLLLFLPAGSLYFKILSPLTFKVFLVSISSYFTIIALSST